MSTTSSWSRAAARTRSKTISTCRSSSRRFSRRAGKKEQLAEIRQISSAINLAYVRQGEPLGLGHAVLVTRTLVGDEPFAVILADDVIDATPPGLAQMIEVFDEFQGPVLALEEVPWESVSSYGIIDAEEIRPGIYRIRDMVEKPPRAEAPSNLAIIGRYILTPDIFPILEATKSDRTGEIQLTNGLRRLLRIGRSTAAASTASATTPATSWGF